MSKCFRRKRSFPFKPLKFCWIGPKAKKFEFGACREKNFFFSRFSHFDLLILMAFDTSFYFGFVACVKKRGQRKEVRAVACIINRAKPYFVCRHKVFLWQGAFMTSQLRQNVQASQAVLGADDVTTLHFLSQVYSLSIWGPQVDTLVYRRVPSLIKLNLSWHAPLWIHF